MIRRAAEERSPKPRHPRRRAMTLAELLLAMGVFSILAGVMVSALAIASHALPDDDDTSAAMVVAAEALDRMAGDLRYALTIEELGGRRIEVTVPDRDGDGSPERIEYRWGGLDGDPLTRRLNDADRAPLLEAVQHFRIEVQQSEDEDDEDGEDRTVLVELTLQVAVPEQSRLTTTVEMHNRPETDD